MEILTLIKANIRHKKGSFISIIILMILISTALTFILSLKDNCQISIENALNHVDAGNLNVYIKEQNKSDELMQSVLNSCLVKDVKAHPTVACGSPEVNGYKDGNSYFMEKLRPEIKLLNSNLDGYEDNVPPLKSGEVYIPQGICTNLKCDIGDTITAQTIAGEIRLKIVGIVIEPTNGSAMMGWKQVFISDEDFDKFYDECKQVETEDMSSAFHFLEIYKADDCPLTDAQFKRQLNLETGIIDNAFGSLSKDMVIHYVSLFPDIICSILMVFIGFLMIVVLIVMGHTISTGIEMDYVNLGIMKSQGFTNYKIKIIFAIQYLSAQIIGIIIGMLLAFPLTKAFGNVFQPITSILAENHISIGKSLLVMLGILIISGLFIIFATTKIGNISPVKALSGGREDIYFDSRINAPINKKMLLSSLALRQFTSNKRQYVGLIMIVTILVFFMTTIMILSNSVTSKSTIQAMGELYTEIDVNFKEEIDDDTLKEFEDTVEEYCSIDKKYYISTKYLSVDGEELYCCIYKDPEIILGISKGRAPLYDNEIIITDIVVEELNLNIGDTVTVAHNDKRAEYIISGLYQSMNDTGLCFAMSLEGARKLGIENIYSAGYSLSDPSKSEEIADALNEKFGDIIEAESQELGGSDPVNLAVNVMKVIIYFFSIIFALVVVHMVCSKTFLREKTHIGIYKALGFTSNRLRLQFAIRFLIVSIIGSILSCFLSILLTNRLLNLALRSMGITNFIADFTPLTFIIPITLICICFFLFAYMATRKIKSVEVRELVIE